MSGADIPGRSVAKTYDPTLLLDEARQLRQKAAAASLPVRNIYRSLADEAERRAILSLNTPIIKETAILQDNIPNWEHRGTPGRAMTASADLRPSGVAQLGQSFV